VKFQGGSGLRFSVVPFKVRLYFASQKTPSVAREVYYSLLQHLHGDPDNFRDIPQTRLAGELAISVRQVERGIAWLKEHELIQVKTRAGYPHLYILNQWPKVLQGSDRDVMKRVGICPCKWRGWCPVHPSKLSEREWE
jgi:hypothetical protein